MRERTRLEQSLAEIDEIATGLADNLDLLELAEANGVEADFSCRSGICHTCVCTLVEGEVEYINDDAFLPDEEDQVLICSSIPKTNVIIDV